MAIKASAGALIYVKTLERMARFYRQLLGLTVRDSSDDHVLLASASVELLLHAIPAPIASRIDIAEPPQLREETPIKLWFPVASIAEARALAATLGGQVQASEREWDYHGIRICDGHDPEGNVFQLRQSSRSSEA